MVGSHPRRFLIRARAVHDNLQFAGIGRYQDAMCYERDYKIFEDRKKAEDTRVVQERRAGLIDRLLNAANKPGEKTKAEGTPVKEVAPAK